MNETLGIIVAVAAAVGAAGYLVKKAWKIAKFIEALHGLAQNELTPNGGGSLHDKITRTDKLLSDHLVEAADDRRRLSDVERHLGL